MAKLSIKQQKFCDYYIASGNAEESAKKAGYNARGNTTKLLQNTSIKEYLKEKTAKLDKRRTATMEEVHEFWYATMLNEEVAHKDRLKASEYIAKTHGAFLDRVELSGGVELKTDVIKKYLERESEGGTKTHKD